MGHFPEDADLYDGNEASCAKLCELPADLVDSFLDCLSAAYVGPYNPPADEIRFCFNEIRMKYGEVCVDSVSCVAYHLACICNQATPGGYHESVQYASQGKCADGTCQMDAPQAQEAVCPGLCSDLGGWCSEC
ncbi:MAG: hypothetical protein HY744_22110 [Deltaproteobacteria bacterium]|nr:hypothetical protein [Deltaproteobacteria bacterium]